MFVINLVRVRVAVRGQSTGKIWVSYIAHLTPLPSSENDDLDFDHYTTFNFPCNIDEDTSTVFDVARRFIEIDSGGKNDKIHLIKLDS